MKVVATSDLHGNFPEIPECDLLLIAGDICPSWDHERSFQANWLSGHFRPWLESLPAKEVVWTGGNHDFVLQDMNKAKIDALGGIYLNDEHTVVDGIKIWGSPMSTTFGNWAFMKSDAMLTDSWDKIPKDVNIIMVHGPMYGYGDLVNNDWHPEDPHVGSKTLRNKLSLTYLPNFELFITGHIHEAYGMYYVPGFKYANVSYVNEEYKPVNPPMVFEL